MGRNILKSSVENASFSIIFQIIFRCITFLLNAFIIRTVGQDVLGIMNVRLLLLESTILFLSREPILKACLTDTRSHNWAQVINQIWLSVPISAFLGTLLVYVWINWLASVDQLYLDQYERGCYVIVISCIVDQIGQTFALIAQSFCFVRLKIVLETLYIVFRTFVFVFFVIRQPDRAIDAFSIAQITSSIFLYITYLGFFLWYIPKLAKSRKMGECQGIFKDMQDFPFENITEFMPLVMENREAYLNRNLSILTLSFAKQSMIKQVLTEGERYVMTISPVLTFSEQSTYDIVNNLGSLAARFIFRPIEESAYFYFTQMIRRDTDLKRQDTKKITESSLVLYQLLKIVTSIGLVVVVYGQSYSHALLYLYGGQRLIADSLPVTLLRWHCFAIVLLAVNGVSEGYVFATMTNHQLDRYNYLMVLFSVGFLLISYVATYIFGAVGFVLANCINMAARIVHSIHYIDEKYQFHDIKPLDGLVPDWKFAVVLIICGVLVKISEIYIEGHSILLHIIVGAICFFFTIAVWALENYSKLKSSYDQYKRRVSIKND